MSNKKIPTAILGGALAVCATTLEVNGIDCAWLWIGVFLCFLNTID